MCLLPEPEIQTLQACVMAAGPGSPAVGTEPRRPKAEEALEVGEDSAAAGVAVVGVARTFG